MLIDRKYDIKEIKTRIKNTPITAIIGPRQSGKTTIAKMLNPAKIFDLENPVDLIALENPVLQFSNINGLIVIDEIQRKPDLFPVLRYFCDKNPEKRFLILGSASKDLIKFSSESLAGRISYYILSGFRKEDLSETQYKNFHFRGGLPPSLLAENDKESNNWRKDYIRTFLERDIPQLGIRIPSFTLYRFWMMIAFYHANIVNFSEIARSFGVSDTTVRHYLEILEGTFVLRILMPWYENIGKRLVKRPKIYIKDSGILHSLLSIEDREALYSHPKIGASWEGFALEIVAKSIGKTDEELFFYSVHSGAELDLLWIHNGKKWGCEFKFSDAPKLTKSMETAFKDLNLEKLWVIYPGTQTYRLNERIIVLPLDDVPPYWEY
ncbi:MAG: ATP-binding protein [Brevinematales bacterium]|nr:ATP-binding protein [Brevinematales bacterium]